MTDEQLRHEQLRRQRAVWGSWNVVLFGPVGPTPAVPVITVAVPEYDETEVGWIDIIMDYNFDHGTFPVATMEVWLARDGSLQSELVMTVASSEGGLRHAKATPVGSEVWLRYKIRYKSATVTGPFSEVVSVNISI